MMSVQSHKHCGTIQQCVIAERDQLRADKAELLAIVKKLRQAHNFDETYVDDEADILIAKHEGKP